MKISEKIPQAPVPSGYHFRDIQLEMSLKPFWDNTPETREAVCREMDLPNLSIERGEAAFYGPKADFVVADCIGRDWHALTAWGLDPSGACTTCGTQPTTTP